MTLTEQIDAIAIDIASELGRDWADCGAYERMSYRDEAERRLDGCAPRSMDEPADCVWLHADTPFAANH